MYLIQKDVKNILKEVAREKDLPYKVIEDAYMAQFQYVAEEMKKGDKTNADSFKNVMLRYLGTFQTSYNKLKYWENKLKNKETEE